MLTECIIIVGLCGILCYRLAGTSRSILKLHSSAPGYSNRMYSSVETVSTCDIYGLNIFNEFIRTVHTHHSYSYNMFLDLIAGKHDRAARPEPGAPAVVPMGIGELYTLSR